MVVDQDVDSDQDCDPDYFEVMSNFIGDKKYEWRYTYLGRKEKKWKLKRLI